MVDALERRRLLSVVDPSTILPANLKSTTTTAANVATEISTIHDKLFAATNHLPLVGSAIANATNSASDSLKNLSTSIFNTLHNLSGSVTGNSIKSAFAAALGPTGQNILPTANLSVVLEDTTTTGASTTPNQVDVNLEITGTLFSSAIHPSFSLGLPGVGLSVNGTIQANLTYDVKLKLVVNTTAGYYVDLSASPEAGLTLAVTAPGLSATGSLGFFQLNATDGTVAGNTQLVGVIGLDLSDGASNQLTASNIAGLVSNSTLSATAEADVHLHLALSFGGSDAFPNLATDFDMTWSLASVSLGPDASGHVGVDSSVFGHKPDIHFNNITLDMGSFFTNFLSPIVQKVQAALAPVQPVIDLLNKPAPVLNDFHLCDLNNDGTTTVLEVLESFIGLKSPKAVKFIDTVIAADNFINSIPTSGNGNMTLALGSFEVGGGGDSSDNSDLRGPDADLADAAMTSETDANTDSELSNSTNAKVRSFITALKVPALQGGSGPDDGGGFQLPILTHPSQVFDLLLGQNVDLFSFDTPTLDFNPKISFSVAPIDFLPFLKVEFVGGADFKAHLSMGYDAAGLLKFASHNFAPINAADLLDGFYIVTDPAKTFASASLTLGIGAGLDFGIASGYVVGSVTGTVTFTADDFDAATDGGRMRASTIVNELTSGNPLALFNINGTISAGLDLEAQFLGIPYSYNIATVQLASFNISAGNIPPVPVLGSVDGSGALTIHVGSGPQNIAVSHIATAGDGSETVAITSGGVTQDYSGVRSIFANCGDGNDTIAVFADSAVQLNGTTGDEVLQVGPNEFATLQGGSGNDYLGAFNGPYSPSTGRLVIRGFGGDDTLVAGGGSDSLDGGSNDDLLYGGGGTDTLVAGNGNDTMYAGHNDGLGSESLTGGVGNDTFVADNSFDASGFGGPQRIHPGTGTNQITYDATDLVDPFGPHDTAISQGVTVLLNGVATNPAPRRTTTTTIASTISQTYIAGSVAAAVLAASHAVDTATGQTLPNSNIKLYFWQNNAAVDPVEAGTYLVVVNYAGDATHAPSYATSTLTINPATPTIATLNSLVSFDGKAHVGNVTASGFLGENLNALLHLSYKNLADNSVSTTPPRAVGVYEVLATLDASRDYNAVTNLDTGHTLTISTIFNAPSAVAADPQLFGSLLVDLNGDSKLDLVTEDLTGSAQSLNVFLGNGNGTFQAKKTTNVPFTNGKILELSNFNLQHFAVPFDLNGDNKTDLLIAAVPFGGTSTGNQNGFYFLNGNGDGTFQAPTTENEPDTYAIALGHFLAGSNNAGLVYSDYADSHNSTYGNKITVAFGAGGGSAIDLTVGLAPRGVATGDFNGDGVSDIVVSDTGGTGVILSHGNTTFGAETYFSSKYTAQIAVADLNKDDKQDIVLSDLGGITAYLGKGDGTFQSPSVVLSNPPGSVVSPVVMGDYNGDGTPDIATETSSNFLATSFQVLYGNGDGTFATALNYAVPTTALLAGDLNGDGVSDVIQIDGGGDVNILLNVAPKVAATISAADSEVTYNGQSHAAAVSATGLNTLNLGALLSVSYKNLVTNVVFTSPPTAAGTYAVLAGFAGNGAYNATPTFDTGKRLTIDPATPALTFTSISVAADGAPHEVGLSAIGATGENLSRFLTFVYQNLGNGSTTSTPPSTPGTYKVLASFQGNASYRYIAQFDTGTTITITAARQRAARIGYEILVDDNKRTGGPYGPIPYSNNAAINGNRPDLFDLPGSTYSYFTTNAGFQGGTIATGIGSSGASATVGPQSNIVASLKSTAGYVEPTSLTLSIDLEMNTIAGSDSLSRGIGLGLNANVPSGFNAGNPINNGIIVNAATGNLFFTGSNGGTITAVPGGTYNASLLGAFGAGRFYTLTYTINTSSGAVTNLSLSDSNGTEFISSPGTIPGFVTGTGAANSTANFVDVSSNGNDGSAVGYVGNLNVSVGTPSTAATSDATSISTSGTTLFGTVNASNGTASTLFQYSTDPTFTPTAQASLASGFFSPKGVAVDAAGNVYVANSGLNTIRKVATDSSATNIGSGFSSPFAVAVDASGNVYVADFGNNAVKEILPNGTVLTLGSGFSGPGGVAVDANGNVFVADSGHNAVKEILPDGTIVTIGSGFTNPQQLAIDNDGDLFVADYGNNVIKEILPSGTILTLDYGFNAPVGVAVDSIGDVFVADTSNNAVKEILPGGTMRTIGSGFSLPIGIAVDAIGNVYVGDFGSNRLVKLTPSTITPAQTTVTGNQTTFVSAALDGLNAGTLYYYRMTSQGAGGTAGGLTQGFVTAPAAHTGIVPVNAGALNIADVASYSLGTAAANADRIALIVSSLSLGNGAKLDLGGNDLIVHNDGSLTGAQLLANIEALLKTGYAGGAWTGLGITSSIAAANAVHLTSLGVKPITATGTFDGQAVSAGDVVVKYTLYGDANLDGAVDFTDLLALAKRYGKSGSDWSGGDFNFDGTVDFSDLLALAHRYGTALPTTAPAAAAPVAATASGPSRRADAQVLDPQT